MNTLVFSWTCPNHGRPLLGSFVHERTKALARRVEVRAVARITRGIGR